VAAAVAVVLVLVGGVAVVARGDGGDGTGLDDRALASRRDGASPTTLASTTTTTTSTTVPPTTLPPTTAPPATDPPAAPPPRPPATASAKKGVSVWEMTGLGAALDDVGAAWYYNWASGPTSGAGGAAEFVPMIWGARSVNADELARARDSGSTLLGFNEPDFDSQANMTVEQALDLWPQLEATGMRLGSPAVAVGGADAGGWLDRSMSGARQRGLRVDFVTLHWYGSDFSPAAVGHLRGYIEAVHERYGLPIWLTEYALIRWEGGGSTYPSDAEQAAFVEGSTAMLQSLPYVERYAWFALPTPDDEQGTGLYRHDARSPTPTPAGQSYRAAG
jgi:hypothetical protein